MLNGKIGLFLVLLIGSVGIVSFTVPIMDVTVENVEYLKDPLNSSETIFSWKRKQLSAFHFAYEEAEVKEGMTLIMDFDVRGMVDAFLFTEAQFTNYQNGREDDYMSVLRSEEGEIMYEVLCSEKYWFVLSNLEVDDVSIISWSCTTNTYKDQWITKKVTFMEYLRSNF